MRITRQYISNLTGQNTFRSSRFVLPAAVLVAITLLAYAPAMRAGFIWDDDDYVQHNPTLRSLEGLRQIWFKIGATPQYYPMVHTSYWLEYRLWKLNPVGYHIVNILLHAAGALLLWRILRLLEIPAAWFIAAVFALHPVHVESVAWITERKNVLSGVFYFAAALAYLRYAFARNSGSIGSKKLYAVSLFLFVCALFSKTVTCSLPLVLLIVLWWKTGHVSLSDIRALIPFFILGIGLGLLTIWMEKHSVGAVGQRWELSFVERGLLAGRAICFYAGKLLLPVNLTFIYPRWDINAALWPQYLFTAAVITAVLLLWLFRTRSGKGAFASVIIFIVTLAPALGFFDVYPMRYSFVADHFQYLASTALITLIVVAARPILIRAGKGSGSIAAAAAVVALLTMGLLSWRQCLAYTDIESLWRDTIKKNPHCWLAQNNLGMILDLRGENDKALIYYQKALQVEPENTETLSNIASALAEQGKFDEALVYFNRALQVNPDHPAAHYNLAHMLKKSGRPNEAVSHYYSALRAKPDFIEARYNLALLLESLGKIDEALQQYRQLIKYNPDNVFALSRAAKLLTTPPQPQAADIFAATRLAERAAELTGYKNITVLETLAGCYAAAGLPDKAVSALQTALDLAAATKNTKKARSLRSRLNCYNQKRPDGNN